MQPNEPIDSLLEDLRLYGDRTSSFMTAYPGFKSFRPAATLASGSHPGQIRFMETPKAWVAGTEPLTSVENKAALFERFENAARENGKQAIMIPVAEALSSLLLRQGYQRLQVGAEPIFDLEEYFSRDKDPLDRFPHARALFRRGARVKLVSISELEGPRKHAVDEMTRSWLQARHTVPLHFLNQVDPWRLADERKIFLLEQGDKVLAFLSAVPVFPRGGFFYADYIRRPDSKAGTVELLFIESMRMLKDQGFQEVSLGACPLAGIKVNTAGNSRERLALRAMHWFFERGRFPYRFKSIHDFKAKLQPTRWEPLYLVSRNPLSLGSLRALASVHFPGGILGAWGQGMKTRLNGLFLPKVHFLSAPRSMIDALGRAKLSLGIGTFFFGLHVARSTLPVVQMFYEAHGFSAGNFTWSGLFIGPLFHNNHYHLSGDLLSFWAFGILLEILTGPWLFIAVMAAGLWLTNPIAWGILHFPLKLGNPVEFTRLMAETDYGSSNAIYAFVGALAAWLRDPRWLLAPFVLNGIFLCVARESWLSIHHLVGLALGFVIGKLWLRYSRG